MRIKTGTQVVIIILSCISDEYNTNISHGVSIFVYSCRSMMIYCLLCEFVRKNKVKYVYDRKNLLLQSVLCVNVSLILFNIIHLDAIHTATMLSTVNSSEIHAGD